MAAGPWFTVRTNESGWQVLADIWISNGATDEHAVVEYRPVLEEPAALVAMETPRCRRPPFPPCPRRPRRF